MTKTVIFLLMFLSFTKFALSDQTITFNPKTLAETEMKTWKDYYNNNAEAVAEDVTRMISQQYHLSNTQAWKIVIVSLTEILIRFHNMPKKTTEQQYKKEILPLLITAYENLKENTHSSWDPQKVAKADLEWWIYRRNESTANPEIVGRKMDELFKLVYGPDDQLHFARAAYLRSVAARYRDLCKHKWKEVLESDWQIIQKILIECYEELALGIAFNEKWHKNEH